MKIKKFLLLFTISFMLLGCSAPNEKEKEPNEDPAISEEENIQDEEEPAEGSIKLGDTFVLGDFEIKINSIERATDMDDNDAVILDFDWTNNSEETTSWTMITYVQAFQDGQEIEHAYGTNYENDNYSKDIRPGNTMENVEESFVITSDSDIEVEITEAFSFSNEKALIVLELPTE